MTTPELDRNYQAATTRAEFCRAAVKFIEKYYNKTYPTILTERGLTIQQFSDTSDPIIGAAAALGITQGTGDNKFSPNLDLTREQAATMLNRVLIMLNMEKNYPDVSWTDLNAISDWAKQSINNIYALGVMNGTSATSLIFSPKSPYTHEQSIATLLRLWKAINS